MDNKESLTQATLLVTYKITIDLAPGEELDTNKFCAQLTSKQSYPQQPYAIAQVQVDSCHELKPEAFSIVDHIKEFLRIEEDIELTEQEANTLFIRYQNEVTSTKTLGAKGVLIKCIYEEMLCEQKGHKRG